MVSVVVIDPIKALGMKPYQNCLHMVTPKRVTIIFIFRNDVIEIKAKNSSI